MIECIIFSSNMNSGMNSPGAAAASCNMKSSVAGGGGVGVKNSRRGHGGARVGIIFFIPPLSFIFQLAAAAPGPFILLFICG